MIFHKIQHAKIAEAVIQQIEDLIVEGVLRPGDRLPAERELAKLLDVSRPSLRDAIKELEQRGLLTTRRGGGTFVGDVIGKVFADAFVYLFRSNDRAINDYIEFRREIDVIAASHAAERATDADKKILSETQAHMRAAAEQGDLDAMIRYDTDFHLAVIACAHNVVLLHAMRSIYEQMVPIFYQRLPRHPDGIMINEILDQHEAILEAILASDPEAARQAVIVHANFIETTWRDADHIYWRESSAQRRLEMLSKARKQRANANMKQGR